MTKQPIVDAEFEVIHDPRSYAPGTEFYMRYPAGALSKGYGLFFIMVASITVALLLFGPTLDREGTTRANANAVRLHPHPKDGSCSAWSRYVEPDLRQLRGVLPHRSGSDRTPVPPVQRC